MQFRLLALGSCCVVMCIGLVGCTGSTGLTVQNRVLPPSITTQPANQTVTAGQSATFAVGASGAAPLSYQWQKNSTNITGATSSSYTTPATTTADSNSTFDVVVTNTAGSVTSKTATLTVNPAPVAPSITTQPANQTVTAGQTATFSVVASGTAPLSYQWQKNSTNISGATSSSYTTPATTTADNNSTFDVVVTNAVGSVTSKAAALTVNPAPVAPTITTTSLPSGQMQAAYVFPLQATGGTPPYTWSALASSVPLGLTLSPAGGIVAGIPTVSGSFTLNVQVRDAAGSSASAAFPMSIATPPAPPLTALFGHVFLVVEENHNYGDVVGSSSMPYLNGLMNQFGLATEYFANTHPSIGNYFMLTTGQILTNDDSQTPSSFPVSENNVVRELLTAGKTWKGYGEGLPSVGYTGGDWSFKGCIGYVRHFPLAYMTDVQNSATQKLNLVPFTQFATDLANGTLPNYSFVTPDGCNDLHDGSAAQADSWLQTNIAPLLTNSQFTTDGLLIIVFDESGSDHTNGGGRVEWMVAGPKVKPAYQSTTPYQHQSTLRMMLETQGITSGFAGAAASAPDMAEFFGTSVVPVSVSISPTSASVLSGGTQQFSAKVSNTSNTAVTWSATAGSISASGLYTGPTVTANSSATVTATSVTDPSKSASAIVSITGMRDFSVSASPLTPGTVSPGASSTATVNVTTTGGFSSAVALSCSVQPLPSLAPKCSISPNSTTAGTAAMLTVSTTGPTAGALPSSAGSTPFYAVWLSLVGLVVAGGSFGSERTRKGEVVILAWVLLTGLVFQVACGGGSGTSSSGGGSSGTPTGTYTITVTGTS